MASRRKRSLFQTLDDLLERLLRWVFRNGKALSIGLALVFGVWALFATNTEEATEPEPASLATLSEEIEAKELYGSLWIDKMPKGHKDSYRLYFFLKGDHPIGVHILFHSMTYRTQEFFMHEVKGRQIALKYPDPGVVAKTKFKIQKVRGKGPFDRKLSLERDPQTKGVAYEYFRVEPEAMQALQAYGLPSLESLQAQARSQASALGFR